jgi:hypothetical protein
MFICRNSPSNFRAVLQNFFSSVLAKEFPFCAVDQYFDNPYRTPACAKCVFLLSWIPPSFSSSCSETATIMDLSTWQSSETSSPLFPHHVPLPESPMLPSAPGDSPSRHQHYYLQDVMSIFLVSGSRHFIHPNSHIIRRLNSDSSKSNVIF